MENETQNLSNTEATLYFSNQSLKLSGFDLKLSRFEKSIMIGNRRFKKKEYDDGIKRLEKEKLSPDEIRKKTLKRAKNKVIDLMLSNAWHWKKRNGKAYLPIFITFTFRDNVTELDYANKEFTKFIRRLSYNIRGKISFLKYLAVIEFQERSAIHYHVVFFNLPWIDRICDKMRDEWRKCVGEGSARVESVKSVKGMIGYLTKYLTKSSNDDRLLARKSYFPSRGLKQPIRCSSEEVINLVRPILPDKAQYDFYEYENEFLKRTEIYCYNLRKYPKVYKKIKEEILKNIITE